MEPLQIDEAHDTGSMPGDSTGRESLTPGRGRGSRRALARPDRIPAQDLQRILSLSATASPGASQDQFAQELALTASTIGDFACSVTFLYDAVDDAFYAEAGHNVDPKEWHDLLALS